METNDTEMQVTKRSGTTETVSFDKILRRIKRIGKAANLQLNYTALAMKVIDQLYDGISTTQIDELTAEQCAALASTHPDYNVLAGRIIVSNHHKNTSSSFQQVISSLYLFVDKHGKSAPLVSSELYALVDSNADLFENMLDYERDYLIDYFGFKTLERAYLLKIDGKSVERPQHMWLRVSIGIHGRGLETTDADMAKIRETYDYMSQKYFTHATPTLFNAGTPRPQLSSCFLLQMESDSIDGIYNTLKDCAQISKMAGGIGLHIHNVRATGSHIRGTNGTSNGIVPMLKVFNATAKYVDQCVVPETIIFTTDGPKQIQHCSVGETSIFNLNGETELIKDVLEHAYKGEVLEIETEFTFNKLTITPQHPIYVLRNHNNEFARPEWIEAGELMVNDKIIYSIPTYEKDISGITEDDCRMYGYIVKHGSVIDEYRINIAKNNRLIDFIKQYLDSKYVEYRIEDEYITWKPSLQLPFRYSDFYNETGRKCIHHRWLNLSLDKIKVLSSVFEDFEYDSTIDSQVNYLLLRLAAEKLSHGLEYVNNDNSHRFVCTKIESISKTSYSGILYDLQMEKQHDYLLESGLVHNGGGKRNGSFAIYLEPWHADIEMFLQMRKNHGDEELKARDLFYALWIPDLFMKRVKENATWTLMCPDEYPGLADVYGDEFDALYEKYETENSHKAAKVVKARDLWFKILDAQMETGMPYLLYKDAANKKSNQKNIGTIKSSNLCTEILQVSSPEESAVCNLASIALPNFVMDKNDFDANNSAANDRIDYTKLHAVAKIVTYNLNRVIDINYYPTEKTRRSNLQHRPVGIGVQGLADVFMKLRIAFTSDAAKEINRRIFETIYHAALEASCELAEKDGAYSSFKGSPASQGILQFDLWTDSESPHVFMYDWADLKQRIMQSGLRNSLLVAPMPTASTSQILGFNECIEPITSNIYSRRTNAGEFILANRYLLEDLIRLNLWNEKMKNNIIANNGSIQHLDMIPQEIRELYKTVWEIPMKHLIDMSADRGVYVCQSQSLNLWLEDPDYASLTSMHFYAWKKGLKTGIYYLRRRGKHQAQQFTIEPEKATHTGAVYEEDEICEMCSS